MFALVRLLLLGAALLVGVLLVVTHGVRGIAVLVVIAVLASLPRTAPWRVTERALVRLTGSRRRAAALVLGIVIVVLVAVNVYSFVHRGS